MDFAGLIGFKILGLSFSPVRGPEGNIEYLLYIKKDASRNREVAEIDEAAGQKKLNQVIEEKSGISCDPEFAELIRETVEKAHGEL
jgi:23S rRNA (cytidine1920-2'-O)/16S rRNA (cytidine1409-2'-O)-methyltransferase